MISGGYFVMIRLILTHPPSQKPVPELLRCLCRLGARKWTRGAPQIDSAGSQRWCAWRKTIFVVAINFHRPSAGFFALVRPLPAPDGARSALGITGGACAGLGDGSGRPRPQGWFQLAHTVGTRGAKPFLGVLATSIGLQRAFSL